MGVPKFFRYISERYPCLSEVVKDYQIPEFDNMYLDMNGIIHNCSHPDDNNPHFRIAEEKIFKDIFHYLEVLFRMIRPRKLFFMAIDGVAPRAKMNQQRGRRFRSVKDAIRQEEEALKRGEMLPSDARFDSNCITPGTVFMARLHEQLKYFVVDKISNDPLWQNVAVILSGHETPGEGEHKIMDYIRYVKAQPGYDPNTRHCLYGLDADLIMLGLCTHEPHFSLLREEVKFGKKSTKRESVPEEITFFLLHLSLMREYLELEFQPMKDKLVGFEYDFEKVIDDWVLMGFLVGNDFIPPLPNLHITNGALPIIYKAYMEVLPTLDGYINEAGTLKLARFEKFMQQLANFDLENFEEIRDDLLYMEVKTGRKYNAFFNVSSGKDLEKWASEDVDQDLVFECLEPKQNTNQIDSGLAALIKETEEMCLEDSDSQADDEGDDVAFENYKKEYYKNKLEYAKVTPEVMRDQAEGYVRAIQWNLNYYYNGVCSWSWYYPHHYAPYISDIKGFSNLKIEFDLGTPFKPYEQLLAVLPTASKTLLPSTYHHLMTSDESPIKKYYPDNFQTDLNGKKQEWEAVVLIPFMDENLLLDAMKKCNEKLTPEEQKMNTHGPMLMYNYTDEYLDSYEAPAYFPSVRHNHARVVPISIDDIRVPSEKLIKGIYPGAAFDIYYPGFPTMKHLQYKGELHKAKVKVFEQPSRYENMILKIVSNVKYDDNMPINLLGSTVFVAWPHLIEARIVAISNEQRKYIWIGDKNQYNTEDYDNKNHFKAIYGGIVERYKTRLGVEVGTVEIICHVQEMIGRKYLFGANGHLSLEKQFSECTSAYPLQTVVSNISVFDQHHSTLRDVLDVFPEGEICFTLCNPYYGSEGIVLDSKEAIKGGRIKICISVTSEPDFTEVKRKHTDINRKYRLLSVAASQLGMSHYLYSRITGSLYVMVPDGEGGWKNVNVGLDLKFTKKNRETPGYTKKISNVWYYSERCTELVREYAEQFPKIFQYFSQNENADVTAEVIFGDDWDIKIKELQDWLKNLSTHGIEKRTSGSHFMESEVVNEIEYTVDNYLKTTDFKSVTMQVKPNLLYKPELQSGNLSPDNKMVVELFDRIVNIRKGFTVPFGLKGTVILKSETSPKNELDIMYDIVFDKPFKDGMTLNYCSAERGYRLPKSAFINISYGIRLLEKKTGKQESLMSKALKHQNVWQSSDSENLVNETKPNDSAYRARFQSSGFIKRGSAFASFNNQQATPKKIYQKPQQRKSIDLAQYKKSKNNQKPNEDCLKQLSSKPVQDAEDFPMKTIMIKPETTTEYKTRGSVNTAFLKNLLRIDPPNSENAAFLKSEIKENKPKQTQFSSDSTSNVSFEMLAEVAKKAPASVKLLTYYQSNNLGTPRYQYFQTHGMFKAQITLPNKELVVGDSAQNKEEATENVAAIVLEVLIKKAKGKDFSPKGPDENLPVPPKTWVKPLKEPVSTNEKVSRRPDQALKTALHNPFIPTQVIKRQTSRSSDDLVQDVYPCTSYINKKSHMVKSISKNNKMKQELEGLNRHNDRTKRSRRSRIAANFASIEQN